MTQTKHTVHAETAVLFFCKFRHNTRAVQRCHTNEHEHGIGVMQTVFKKVIGDLLQYLLLENERSHVVSSQLIVL